MRRIKCGVLGAGWWATFAHIPAILDCPDAELIAIQKRDRIEARKVADDFDVPFACTTAEELLSIPGLDAVVIASSPNLHYAQAKAALESGKHVLIEKPMTITASEAEALVALAQRNQLQFLISCPWHFTPHAAQARRIVRQGELGEIRMISMLMTNPVSHLIRGVSTVPTHGTPYLQPKAATYADPRVAGGGQIYAQVSHAAAYLTFLTGDTACDVHALFHNDGAAMDIYDILNIRMNNGSLVSIASTGATGMDRRDYEVRIFGTQGMLFLELWRGTMLHVDLAGKETAFPALEPDEIYPHRAPVLNLIESIVDPAKNQSPASLGVAAMGIVEAACISAASGKVVAVESLFGQPV
jgi:predicted dehydrogenase